MYIATMWNYGYHTSLLVISWHRSSRRHCPCELLSSVFSTCRQHVIRSGIRHVRTGAHPENGRGFRLEFPANYRVAPHWHPADEHVTVIAGTFALGMGETFDETKLEELGVGGFAMMRTGTRHFAWSKDGAVVQLHGIGPWGLTYVNPADDPRNAAKP